MAYSYIHLKPVRNVMFQPDLRSEGRFLRPLPEPVGYQGRAVWYDGLSSYERVFYHQTLSSARRYAFFEPSPLIPNDALDFCLASRYNHSYEIFGEKVDTLLQLESVDMPSFRRIRNSMDREPVKIIHLGHPLRIGGLREKISPHSVKLINSGHHSQMTNPGYSRQPADGNTFNY